MSYDESAFQETRALKEPVDVVVGNNAVIPAEVEGDVPLKTMGGTVVLVNVLYVPQLAANLVSCTRLMKKGCLISNTTTGVKVETN
jgi:hypothetical protein